MTELQLHHSTARIRLHHPTRSGRRHLVPLRWPPAAAVMFCGVIGVLLPAIYGLATGIREPRAHDRVQLPAGGRNVLQRTSHESHSAASRVLRSPARAHRAHIRVEVPSRAGARARLRPARRRSLHLGRVARMRVVRGGPLLDASGVDVATLGERRHHRCRRNAWRGQLLGAVVLGRHARRGRYGAGVRRASPYVALAARAHERDHGRRRRHPGEHAHVPRDSWCARRWRRSWRGGFSHGPHRTCVRR